jgi:hypothetical protein
MLSNAVIAGLGGAVYLAVLCLQLNPRMPLYPDELGPLLLVLGIFYGANLTAFMYVLFVARQIFSARIFSPGWISLRLLSWSFTGLATATAVLMWLNLRGYASGLDGEAARRMAAGATGMSVCAFVFLVIAVVHYSFGRPGTLVGATLFAVTAVASVALPVTARGPGQPASLGSRGLGLEPVFAPAPRLPRVAMVLLDGAELDFISLAALEGRLPSFGRVLDAGASMHLATVRPTQPNPVWTTVATGKLPAKTGIRSNAVYRAWFGTAQIELLPDYCFAHGLVRFGFLEEVPHTAASVRVRSLWSILSSAGVSVGIVGWPLTHPAQPVRGYLVTDQFYKQDSLAADPDDPAGVSPPDVLDTARVAAAAREPAGPPAGTVGIWSGSDELPRSVVQGSAWSIDRLYERVHRALSTGAPRVTAVRYRLLDYAGHYYLRYADPRAFGDVTEEERRGFGRVLEASYGVIDDVIRRAIDDLEPGGLLLVISAYGMKPLPLEKRMLERLFGEPELSGTHEGAPDGFLLAYGRDGEPGRKRRGSLVDVLPTLLYYLGLPVGRDMDGYARTDLFTAAFADARPLTFIPSYDR